MTAQRRGPQHSNSSKNTQNNYQRMAKKKKQKKKKKSQHTTSKTYKPITKAKARPPGELSEGGAFQGRWCNTVDDFMVESTQRRGPQHSNSSKNTQKNYQHMAKQKKLKKKKKKKKTNYKSESKTSGRAFRGLSFPRALV